MKIIIINGPNLNLLGIRKKEIYGTVNFGQFFEKLQTEFPGINLEFFQSNSEGKIIDKLHESGFSTMELSLMQEHIHILPLLLPMLLRR